MSEVLLRKPAPIVKCPHCNWKGSARGLFTHVRMAHPAINTKPPTAKFEHPLDVKNDLFSSRVSNFIKVNRDTKKSNSRFAAVRGIPITKEEQTDFITTAILVPLFIHIFSQPDIKEILTSEGVNPKRLLVALGKI